MNYRIRKGHPDHVPELRERLYMTPKQRWRRVVFRGDKIIWRALPRLRTRSILM